MPRISIPHIWSPNEHAPSLVSTVRDAKATFLSFMLHNHGVAVTEKPDGMYYEVGFDADGLYTSTQTMKYMRYPSQYIQNLDFRSIPECEKELINFFQKSNNLSVLEKFHTFISEDSGLRSYMRHYYKKTGRPVVLRGELLHPDLAQEIDEDGIVFNHVKYRHLDEKIPRWILYEYFPTSHAHQVYFELEDELMSIEGMYIDTDLRNVGYEIPKLCEAKIYDEWIVDVLEGKEPPKRRDDNEYRTVVYEAKLRYDLIWNELYSKFPPRWGDETEGYVLHQLSYDKPLKERTVQWNHVKVINPNLKRIK